MTIANSLKGTRMGRPVKSEAEVLEECRNYQTTSGQATSLEELSLDVGGIGDSQAIDPAAVTSRMSKQLSGSFIFYDVPYQGGVLPCVERPLRFLDNRKSKTQEQHLQWLCDPANNMTEYTIADMELEYQFLRISFDLRNHLIFGQYARRYLAEYQALDNPFIVTADQINYFPGLLDAVIKSKSSIQSKSKTVPIPVYPNSLSVLSYERPEQELNLINALDNDTISLLGLYLGEGFERAGAILPYAFKRKNGDLRRTLLATPDFQFRIKNPTCAGGFGLLNTGQLIVSSQILHQGHALPVALVELSRN